MAPRILVMIGCLATLAPAFAQDDLKIAPARLSLTLRNEPPDELCRRFDPMDASPLATMSLHRTFHVDFDAPADWKLGASLRRGRATFPALGKVSVPETILTSSVVTRASRKTP